MQQVYNTNSRGMSDGRKNKGRSAAKGMPKSRERCLIVAQKRSNLSQPGRSRYKQQEQSALLELKTWSAPVYTRAERDAWLNW